MYLAIDGRPLIRQPHSIEIVLPEDQTAMTPEQRPLVFPGGERVVLNCTWGRNMTYEKVVTELGRVRADRGVHSVTFEPRAGCRYLTINAWMGRPRQAHVGYTFDGKIVLGSFTIPFYQVDLAAQLFCLSWKLMNIIALGDQVCRHLAPNAGTIMAVDGYIADLGAGGGQTRIQISNGAVDYLAVRGDFVCAPPDKIMQNQVLGTNLTFAQGDPLDIDVDSIPAGGLSKDATILAWCLAFRP